MKPASQYKNVQVSNSAVLQMPGSDRVMHYWKFQDWKIKVKSG